QLALAEYGRVHVLVAGLALQLADVLLQRMPDGSASWQPVRQPSADQRIGIEQAEFAAKLAVVVQQMASHGGLLAACGWRASDHRKPRSPGALAPGLRLKDSCQRAGTCSGVVSPARFMPQG